MFLPVAYAFLLKRPLAYKKDMRSNDSLGSKMQYTSPVGKDRLLWIITNYLKICIRNNLHVKLGWIEHENSIILVLHELVVGKIIRDRQKKI